ncbi:MAG: EAL domain-containing protein [Gammaproteobacteria bacterium]|nr:EAL domain-containing protein [Gammaproteobacteria bacterium]
MIKYMALGLTIIGVIFLLYAARPTLKISTTESHRGWQVLLALICFFIVGYMVYIAVLLSVPNATVINLIMASILFGGSIFVVLVIYLSRVTLEQSHQVASQEQYNALHDDLTGLPNRKYLLQHLDRQVDDAKTSQLSFAVMLLDLDEFKSINDTLGHFVGDLLLAQLASRLQDRLAPDIFLARMGGDEFALVVPDADPVRINSLSVNIRNYLREPFDIDGHMISISACPGVVYFPTHGDSTAILLQRADIAMYMAKRQKLLLVTYDTGMAAMTKKNLALAARLPAAIAQQEFELFYQPLMHSDNQQIFGVEALIRWPQPDQTLLPPDLFIPLAEQSYLIRDITRWVLQTGLRQLGEWHAAGHKITLQVNISSRDLDENTLSGFIVEQLHANNLPASCLTLEITESAIVRNRTQALKILAELSELGVCVSLDDFGTGYSSMTLLDELPLKQVKIDRSFVVNIESNHSHQAIVQSTINLGSSLGLMVVAEGIENRQQVTLLAALGCDLLQGFFIAKPMDTGACSRWLQDNK